MANVSTATVSRALSTPGSVAEGTRRAVIEAVERSGYRVNQTARNLRRKQAGAIVVLVPNIGNPFFSRILAGIEATASKAGLNVLIADTRQPQADEGPLGEYLHNNHADGMLVLDGSLRDDFFSHGNHAHPPIVYACEWSEGTSLPSIRFDNAGGSALAVDHLAGLGHTSIGHILGPLDNVLTQERRRGFEAALARHGLRVRNDWYFDGDFTLASGANAALSWLALADRPTAITTSSDEMACGFMSELYRHGVHVPDDVSVVGFDDIDIAERFIPALTTIRQPRMEIGEVAANALIDLIRAPDRTPVGTAFTKVLDATLIVRSSTRATAEA
ncbi:transcriptional regulator, LacI family [Mesorhizobium albiziae]|uniref:Transcriptional regulator, LacI family n=2 Tax=Neomesorhizobium albiziae TaxID=335020 RepID=A0A1I3WMU2_9HYPH|nr:transcriptional regulator, LacI family [Mesorhizobium albiziae]